MSGNNELALSSEDYDKAFTEVSFLLDMFVDTIGVFIGKSTPALAVAAGRKMAANMPIHITEPSPENALGELIRVFQTQQMEIEGRMENGQAMLLLNHCPIGSVCKNRGMELGGQACQMFHYYIAGIMAELTGVPARPKTIEIGDQCTFSLAFSGVHKPA
jgi:hypothetical protein